MKKISMFFAALAVAVSSFATPATYPTAADLLDYYEQGQLCVCVYFEAEICNDVVFAGSYNNWDTSDPANMAKFAELPGFEGWYYVAVTDTCADIQGKPVQLNADGSFTWDNQTGNADSWEIVSGTVTIGGGYNADETDLKGYSTAEPVILISKYFKAHKDICSYVAEYADYTILLNAPFCSDGTTYFEPAIIGDFNGWAEGVVADDINEDGYYVFNLKQAEKTKYFKFRAAGITDWSNQIQIQEVDENGDPVLDENGAEKWIDNPDVKLGDETTITLDYSNGRYTLCVDAEETAVEDVVVEKTAVKTIKDGQLVIEMNGKLFNILGAEVK